MNFLIIQEAGRHAENARWRECESMKRSLEGLGHDVIVWGLNQRHNHTDWLSWYAGDWTIIQLEEYDQTNWLPDLSACKALKILWARDTHVKGPDYHCAMHARDRYDIVLQSTRTLCGAITPDDIWFPNCYDPDLCHPIEAWKKTAKVGFVGNQLNRGPYLEQLKQAYGRDFACDIFVIGKAMNQAINSMQVHFNRNIGADINYRNFETIGAGAVLLVEPNDLEGYNELGFYDGLNCVFYSEPESLVKMADYAIAHCEPIAQAGLDLAKRHTYDARCQDLMTIIEGRI